MAYKAHGVIIEGIWDDPITLTPAILGGGMLDRLQYIDLDSKVYAFKPNVLAATPQLSSTDLDVFTSKIRSGSISIKINAASEISRHLLAQNITRKPDATLGADILFDDLMSIPIGGSPVVGQFYFLGEEVIKIDNEPSPGLYDILRGCGDTPPRNHAAGDGLYTKPNYWIGRTVKVVVMTFSDNFNPSLANVPTKTEVIWRGYLSAAPASISGTNTIELKADDILSALNRVEVNKIPFTFSSDKSVTTFLTGDGVVGSYGPLINDDPAYNYDTRVYKYYPYTAAGRVRPVQVGGSLALAYGKNIMSSARLGSPSFVDGEKVSGPFFELAVWSKKLDELSLSLTGELVSPTKDFAFPYHPLAIAGALLFSTDNNETDNPDFFDVLHSQFSAGLDFLLDQPLWIDMINKTSGVEVDHLVLGWDGNPIKIFEVVLEKLLPAYGFALVMSPEGKIIPIEVGIADIQKFVDAPSVMPLPEHWEWKNIGSEVLDQVSATVGELPWGAGRKVVVNGTSVRTDVGARSTRLAAAVKTSYDFPTVSAAVAQQYALSNLLNRLVWRFDGLPQITLRLPADEPWYCGQWVKLERPDGLITPILYDLNGDRVDDWDDYRFFGQIISCRPIIDSHYYDIKILLTNYVFGKLAKYRAPSCRIKSVLGSGQYLIEGLTSDFADVNQDADAFRVGDQVEGYSSSLAPYGDYRDVLSVTPSGSDMVLQLDSSFDGIDVGDWIVLAPSPIYSNPLRFGVSFPYPFGFQTDGISLNRPGSMTDDPDTFA